MLPIWIVDFIEIGISLNDNYYTLCLLLDHVDFSVVDQFFYELQPVFLYEFEKKKIVNRFKSLQIYFYYPYSLW